VTSYFLSLSVCPSRYLPVVHLIIQPPAPQPSPAHFSRLPVPDLMRSCHRDRFLQTQTTHNLSLSAGRLPLASLVPSLRPARLGNTHASHAEDPLSLKQPHLLWGGAQREHMPHLPIFPFPITLHASHIAHLTVTHCPSPPTYSPFIHLSTHPSFTSNQIKPNQPKQIKHITSQTLPTSVNTSHVERAIIASAVS
jgi:hypothetical protein